MNEVKYHQSCSSLSNHSPLCEVERSRRAANVDNYTHQNRCRTCLSPEKSHPPTWAITRHLQRHCIIITSIHNLLKFEFTSPYYPPESPLSLYSFHLFSHLIARSWTRQSTVCHIVTPWIRPSLYVLQELRVHALIYWIVVSLPSTNRHSNIRTLLELMLLMLIACAALIGP